jgi:hypothetical protein
MLKSGVFFFSPIFLFKNFVNYFPKSEQTSQIYTRKKKSKNPNSFLVYKKKKDRICPKKLVKCEDPCPI